MMSGIQLRHLLIGCVLVAATYVVTASAQSSRSSITPQKRAAIRRLIETTGMQGRTVSTFQQLIGRYQDNWPNAVVAGFKAKGLFRRVTPEQAAKVERLVYEFSDNFFSEIKRRIARQVVTTETLENLTAPTFDKYFEEEEINELVAFSQTPTGKKFIDEYSKVLTETIVADLQARGAFNVLPSAEAEQAKAERLKKEIEGNPMELIQQNTATATAKLVSAANFTEAEIQELRAFSKTALGGKLAEISPRLSVEIFMNNTKIYAPQVGKMVDEVYAEQMEMFERGIREIFTKK